MASKWPYCTTKWKKLRAQHIQDSPLCQYCYEVGIYTAGTVVDHIEPVRKSKDKVFDPENLQTLCDTCHSGAKQKEEARGRAIGCDPSGIPRHGWQE